MYTLYLSVNGKLGLDLSRSFVLDLCITKECCDLHDCVGVVQAQSAHRKY